jgi:hypothetical protein
MSSGELQSNSHSLLRLQQSHHSAKYLRGIPTELLIQTLAPHFVVAACGYGAANTLLQVLDKGSWLEIGAKALFSGTLSGWMAMLAFISLGLTSNDY